jgi:hypothetical protein
VFAEKAGINTRYTGRSNAEYTSFSGQQQHEARQKTAVPPVHVYYKSPEDAGSYKRCGCSGFPGRRRLQQ